MISISYLRTGLHELRLPRARCTPVIQISRQTRRPDAETHVSHAAMSSGGILFLFFLFFFFFSSCSYSSSPPSSSCTSSLLLLFFSLPCGWSVISETLLSILMMGFSSSSRMARRLSVWAADSGRQRGCIIESRYKEIRNKEIKTRNTVFLVVLKSLVCRSLPPNY